MDRLQIVFAYRLTSDGHGIFTALVTGIDKPEPAIELALRNTGGSSCNTTRRLNVRQGYLVKGMYDDDPNYGDTHVDMDRRLRRIVGDWCVALRIHHPDGTVADDGTLRDSEINWSLFTTGSLN